MENKRYTSRELLKRFVPYYVPYRLPFFIDLFCAALTTLNELALPLILRYLTDVASTDFARLSVDLILKVTLLYVILKLVDILAYYYMNNIGHMIGARIETDMRRDIFTHLQSLSTSFYNQNKVGKLMTRITTDLNDVTEFAHHTPEEYFIAAIKFIITFIILIRINVVLTIVLAIIIPIMIYSIRNKNRKVAEMMSKQRSHIGSLNADIEDSLLGMNVVKSFTNENLEIEKFEGGNMAFLNIKRGFYKNLAALHAISRFFDGLMYIAIILIGGIQMMNKTLSPGDLIVFILYANMLTATVRRLVEFMEQFHRGLSGIEKFVEVMDTGSEIFDEDTALVVDKINGQIDFENVTFGYDDEKVLDNISFTAKPGESVGIVGPSGSGKTTIINLIPRFYDVNSGAIKIDGIDIRDIKLESLRAKIGIVQQDVYLFNESIFENIRYGKPDATDEEVELAAKMAGAHEFIADFPDGYDTMVGERGVRLSGGQKQRISIARVFLKNPPILILDEATSALDNKSEKIVQASIKRLQEGRTTITIAHRLTTIMNSDKIIVLTKNGIEEQGNHNELMEEKGMYYNLYTSGFNDFDDNSYHENIKE